MNKTIFECKKYVTNSLYIKKALSLNLNLEEFLLLTYFDNDYDGYLNIEIISENLGISLDKIYETFNSLVKKKIITINSTKDLDGRMIEKVNLDNFYNLLLETTQKETKEATKNDIYSIFEKEFSRPISSMEYEIINAWLEKDYSEDLIIGALKEAVYNGVPKLNYIDKILYEWGKKGYKTMKDVKTTVPKKEVKKELFDYNWLEDEDE